jgi:hypothetical protein
VRIFAFRGTQVEVPVLALGQVDDSLIVRLAQETAELSKPETSFVELVVAFEQLSLGHRVTDGLTPVVEPIHDGGQLLVGALERHGGDFLGEIRRRFLTTWPRGSATAVRRWLPIVLRSTRGRRRPGHLL